MVLVAFHLTKQPVSEVSKNWLSVHCGMTLERRWSDAAPRHGPGTDVALATDSGRSVACGSSARFVAEFVDALDRENWKELGVEIEGDPLGAPGYHPGRC